MKKKQFLKGCLSLMALTQVLMSCSKPDRTETDPGVVSDNQYSLWVTASTGSYILTTDDLMKDTLLSPNNNKGIDITSYLPGSWYGVYAYNHNGKFYISNNGTRFSELTVNDNGTAIKETNNYAFPGTFYMGKVFKNLSSKDQLVITKTQGTTNTTKNVLEQPIYFMNVSDLTLSKTLNVEIPLLNYVPKRADGTDDKTYIVPTSSTVRGDKLFVGHKYRTDIVPRADILDTTYVYVCDYPTMANGKILKDARGGVAAGHWEINETTFVDENNDLYILTKKIETAKYGLIRIKSGETVIDPDYFFDLKDYNIFQNSSSVNIQILGKGKVYISPFVIDPANKKIVSDLRILAGGGESKTTMNFMENGNLYDVFKTDESRWFVFEYNPETNTMRRGAEIDPGVTQVYHINKLK